MPSTLATGRLRPSRDSYCEDRSITPKWQLASAFALAGDRSSNGMGNRFPGCRIAFRTKFLEAAQSQSLSFTRNPRAILGRTGRPATRFIGKTSPHHGTQPLSVLQKAAHYFTGRGSLPD